MKVHSNIELQAFLIFWILMFWRGTFKRRFANYKHENYDFAGWELFLCVYSCEYIKLWYLEIIIASKIQNSAAAAAEL